LIDSFVKIQLSGDNHKLIGPNPN